MELPKKTANYKVNRVSVSAEAFGVHNKKQEFKPKNIPKTDE